MKLAHVIRPSEFDLQSAAAPIVANATNLEVFDGLAFDIERIHAVFAITDPSPAAAAPMKVRKQVSGDHAGSMSIFLLIPFAADPSRMLVSLDMRDHIKGVSVFLGSAIGSGLTSIFLWEWFSMPCGGFYPPSVHCLWGFSQSQFAAGAGAVCTVLSAILGLLLDE
jgi:hypothetical protein